MKSVRHWITGAALIVGAGALLLSQHTHHKRDVSVEEAHRLITHDSTVVVLDVRTPGEFTGELGHISNALLIPIQELDRRLDELEKYRSKSILVVCRTGRRSTVATDLLTKKGLQALNIQGGMVEWNAKGLPTVKNK